MKQAFRLNVVLTVDGDEPYKTYASSYLLRSLRSISDVKIQEDEGGNVKGFGAHYRLRFHVMEIKNRGGDTLGLAIARVLSVHNQAVVGLPDAVKEKCGGDQIIVSSLAMMIDGELKKIPGSEIVIDVSQKAVATENMENSLRDDVALIDGALFEGGRKKFSETMKLIQEAEDSPELKSRGK